MNGRQTQGATLMLTALFVLVLPGIVVNNLQNNGFITTAPSNGVYPMTCTTANGGTCVLGTSATPIGCQANSAFCQLSGSGIAFLNACSPFTDILTLNFVGFVTSFFASCGTSEPQSQVFTGNETIPGLVPVFGLHNLDIESGQSQWTSNLYPHPVTSGITLPVSLTCLGWQQVGYTSTHGYPAGTSTQTQTAQCTFIDSSTPTQVALATSCWLFGNTTDINNAICTNWSPGVNSFTDTGGSGFFNLGGILSFFLSILSGTLLILIGLGVNVGAASFQAGSNPQGSKLVQTFGIALLIWIPFSSEFSTWFDVPPAGLGLMPYGLGNALVSTPGIGFVDIPGIIGVALITMFFIGAYFLSQSGTAASQ